MLTQAILKRAMAVLLAVGMMFLVSGCQGVQSHAFTGQSQVRVDHPRHATGLSSHVSDY